MWVRSGLVLLFIAGNMFKEGNCRSRPDDPVSQAACSLDQCSDEPCWTNCARTPKEIRDKRGIRSDAPVPQPPRNLMLREGTQTPMSFSVKWDPPNIPFEFTGYRINSTSKFWHPVQRAPEIERIAEFDDLDPGKSYEVTIETFSGNVYSPPASLYITLAPLPVENLTALRFEDSTVVLVSWLPGRSSTQDSYKLSYYAVERQTDIPESFIVNETDLKSNPSWPYSKAEVRLYKLLPGWNYSISVQAISNKSESTESMTCLITQPATPTSIHLESAEGCFNVSWETNVKSRQDKFKITWIDIEPTIASVQRVAESKFTTETNVFLTDLYPGFSYQIEVIAISYGINSVPLRKVQSVVPHPIKNVGIDKVLGHGFLVWWEPPDDSFYKKIVIRYKSEENTAWQEIRHPFHHAANAEINNLTSGELYIIRINTVSNQVESLNALQANQTIPPEPVLNMIVTRIPPFVALEWLRPKGRIEIYLIEWWQVKNRTDVHTKNVTENHVSAVGLKDGSRNKRELIIGDLISGVEYSFSIYAASHNSNSTVASLQTTIEPAAGDGLNAVTTRKIRNISDIHVTWDRPESFPDFYIVNITLTDSKSDDPLFHNVSGTATETIFSDVEILHGFIVYVRAWTSDVGGLIISNRFESLLLIRLADDNPDIGALISFYACVSVVISICCCFAYVDKRLQSQNQQSDKYEMSPNRLTITRVLGNGAFGIVKLGSLRDDQGNLTNVAVKMLRDDSNVNDSRSFLGEIKIMKALGKHPNIVSLVGCSTIGPYPFLVVEYCSRGDLHSFLRKSLEEGTSPVDEARKCTVISTKIPKRAKIGKRNCDTSSTSRIDDDYVEVSCSAEDQDTNCDPVIVTVLDMLNFGRQIATGMVFLSSNRIVHRDLATRNVLVCYDRNVKISDFGLSRDIYEENFYKKSGNGRMPLKWMAIEALTHQVYSTHSDVWSFGILLWEIVTLGGVPYPGVSTMELLKRLQSGYRMERPENCSIPLYDLMLSCWQTRPKDRPTFPFLRQELGKLISVTTEHEYLDLNDVPEEVSLEPSSARLQNVV